MNFGFGCLNDLSVIQFVGKLEFTKKISIHQAIKKTERKQKAIFKEMAQNTEKFDFWLFFLATLNVTAPLFLLWANYNINSPIHLQVHKNVMCAKKCWKHQF